MNTNNIKSNTMNLLESAKHGCWNDCRNLLTQYSDILLDRSISEGEYEGFQPIHFFAMHRQAELTRLIIAAGANSSVKTKAGEVPIELALKSALKNQSFETVKVLISAHDDLLIAAREQRWDVCNRALKDGIQSTWSLTGKYQHYNLAHFFVLHDQMELLQLTMTSRFCSYFEKSDLCNIPTPITLAAEKSNWKCVTAIANTIKASPKDSMHYGNALVWAASAHEWSVCELLIRTSNGLQLSIDANGDYPLHIFVENERLDLVKLMISRYHRPALQIKSAATNLTPIALAAKKSLWKCVAAIANHINASAYDEEYYKYALVLAATAHEWDVCETLIKAGASLAYKPDNMGFYPIHHFAAHGQSFLLRLILDHYHSQNVTPPLEATSKMQTPIELAKINKHWDAVHILANHMNQMEFYFPTYAAAAQKWDKCAELIQQGAPLIFEQRNAIHYFAQYGQTDLLLSAVKKGAQLFEKTTDGKTAIQIAANFGQWETILVLSQHIKLTESDQEGYRYAYHLALPQKEFVFCTTMLKQNKNFNFQVVNKDHQVIHAILLKKYDLACNLIVKSDPFIVARIWEFCFSNNVISQFFAQDTDFRALITPLNVAIPLLNAGVPFKKFSIDTQSQLLQTDASAIGPIAYFKLIISSLPKKSLESIEPPKPGHSISTDPITQIGELSNRDFCEFKQFVSELISYFNQLQNHDAFQKRPLNQQVTSSIKTLTALSMRCDDVMFSFIDRKYLSTLYNNIEKKKTYSPINYLWKKPSKTLEMFHPDLVHHYDKATLEALAIIIKEKVVDLSITSPDFSIIFYFACFLSRAFPKLRQSFLPDSTENVGMFLTKCEYCNSNSLIFTGDTLATCSIYIADEVLDILSKKNEFIDPVTLKALEWETIVSLLGHPKIRQTVMELHINQNQGEKDNLPVLIMMDSIQPTIDALKKLSNELWESSTDSGRAIFNNRRADKAMDEFHKHSAKIPARLLPILHDPKLIFYLRSRGKKTNYSELFSELTSNGCSGQLGADIKSWLTEFESMKQRLLKHSSPMSTYVNWIVKNEPNPLYLTESTQEYKMDGYLLSSLFTTSACQHSILRL